MLILCPCGLPFSCILQQLGKNQIGPLLYPLEIETADRMGDHYPRHIPYPLLLHDFLKLLLERRGENCNSGNTLLFEIELVNYQR